MNSHAPILTVALVAIASASFAQQTMTFRLERGEKNVAACSGADGAMQRQQTATIADNVATLKSNGGINDKAKMVTAGVYRTRWSVSGINLDIELNTTASPATLTATEAKLGCRWSGKAS